MPDNTEFSPKIDPSNTTAQDMFSRILNERIQAGALEKAIEEKVDGLINSTADSVFRSYSDLGKAIEKQLTKAIMPALDSLDDLPVYHDFVTNRLKLAAQSFYDERLKDVLDKELQQVFSEVPEQLTLSYIVEKIVENAREYEPEGEITLHIKPLISGSDSLIIGIDKEADESSFSCDYRLHLSKRKESGNYEMLSLSVGDNDSDKRLCAGRLYNIDKILFNVYAMKGEIIVDQGIDACDYETSWSDY
ncbi:hypothetical protein [Pseudoalteromonas sp. S16_S37]|uniref:hypothetical protein n=1 Tax=Pseudoalteromonas sp. S16_S37 TaxID=2720228 RepID=UPI00167FF89D|nr:hypothetical protein [Pseudoalteromonas sp. S16_S37]MBD1583459.1 hypothetical protein [Pseudoalteromonas sp. S16_S37]